MTVVANTSSPELVSSEELVRRARDLVPKLRERAEAAEQARRIPKQTIKDFQEAGFFKILQPRRWGGYAMDPQVFFDVQMTIAEGCMSSAWVLGVVAVHNWQLPLFDERAQQDVWGEDPTTLISSSYAPVGKVTRVDGGFRFSGRWSFSSGCEHCQWAFLGGMVPPLKEGDPPDMRTFLVPRSDYRIEDTWHVLGLKATGSQDVVVEDAFVPEYRTHKAMDGFLQNSPGNEVNPEPLYRLPFGQIFARSVSTASIGGAQGALTAFVETCRGRVTSHGSRTAEDPVVQGVVAEAQDTIDGLKLVLKRNFSRMMECLNEGREIPMEERLRYRYQSAVVPQRCMEVGDRLLTCLGGRGLFTSNRIQRYALDLKAARAHVANQPDGFARNWGGVSLGMENSDFFL